MSDTFSIGVNRLIRIVPPTEKASRLRPEGFALAQQESDDGDGLCNQSDTASRVCLSQDMWPVPCVDIIGE